MPFLFTVVRIVYPLCCNHSGAQPEQVAFLEDSPVLAAEEDHIGQQVPIDFPLVGAAIFPGSHIKGVEAELSLSLT